MFSAPIKGRSRCYASLHCKEYGHTFTTQENVIDRDRSRVIEFLLQLEHKQQIVQINVETQHKHILVVLCSLPYGTLYLHRDFTGVRGNLNDWARSAFYRAENIYE